MKTIVGILTLSLILVLGIQSCTSTGSFSQEQKIDSIWHSQKQVLQGNMQLLEYNKQVLQILKDNANLKKKAKISEVQKTDAAIYNKYQVFVFKYSLGGLILINIAILCGVIYLIKKLKGNISFVHERIDTKIT